MFPVSCSCSEDLAASCFCSIGNAAPNCLAGSLSDCGDPAFCSADLSSDPTNCGRCGHACGGLTCTNGVCQPLSMSFGGSTQAAPDDWVSDGTSLYVASCTNSVVTKIPLGGVPSAGSPVVLSSASQGCARGVAIDGTNVYWLDDGNGSVWTAPMSGTGPATSLGAYGQVWYDGGISLHGMALDGSNLYFAVQPQVGNGFVYSMPKTGGAVRVLTNDSLVLRSTVYVDANNIYFLAWDNAGSYLKSVTKTNDLDAGQPSTLLATFPGDQPFGFTIQGGAFYIGSSLGSTILTVPITGGTPVPLWRTNIYGFPYSLASDGMSLYWTDLVGSYVYAMPLVGGYAQRLSAAAGSDPLLILLAGNRLYWSTASGYSSLPTAYSP